MLQKIFFDVVSSLTINLSFGDLPVNLPVFTLIAPRFVFFAALFFIDIISNFVGLKFQKAS